MNPTDANNSVVETSSTAQEVEQEIPSAGPERIEWQKTGKTTPKADSTPAPEVDKTKSAPASETGKVQEKKSPAAERLEEVLADLKSAGLTPAELKTYKREAAKQTQAEPSPAKQPEVVQKLEAPKEPAMEDPKYAGDDGWKMYEADVRKFNKDFAEYSANQAVEKFKSDQVKAEQSKKFDAEVVEAKKRYPDFDKIAPAVATAINQDAQIPYAVKQVIEDSPVFFDLTYVLGENTEALAEFQKLARTDPRAAIKKVILMEQGIEAKLAGTEAARNDKGQFQPTPEKKGKTVSSAPEPPRELGGKGTPPADEVEAALESDDQAAYNAAKNRRDLASRKG